MYHTQEVFGGGNWRRIWQIGGGFGEFVAIRQTFTLQMP